jgi:hypothetical protein
MYFQNMDSFQIFKRANHLRSLLLRHSISPEQLRALCELVGAKDLVEISFDQINEIINIIEERYQKRKEVWGAF